MESTNFSNGTKRNKEKSFPFETYIKRKKMQLLPVELIKMNHAKIAQINRTVKAIYRLIMFSRYHLDDDLLDTFLTSMHNMTQLLGIKNAQMEAQNEEELAEYLKNLEITLAFMIAEIESHQQFEKELQLFQLLRLVSPEAYSKHPNRYRTTVVQIGAHVCPPPEEVPSLVSELFFQMQSIHNPIIRGIYLHHELIRIHPFADGNGRVTRLAKNWMLMYELYPPIFINDAESKKAYISMLKNSFKELAINPNVWNEYTAQFFEQELDRLIESSQKLYETVNEIGIQRRKKSYTG